MDISYVCTYAYNSLLCDCHILANISLRESYTNTMTRRDREREREREIQRERESVCVCVKENKSTLRPTNVRRKCSSNTQNTSRMLVVHRIELARKAKCLVQQLCSYVWGSGTPQHKRERGTHVGNIIILLLTVRRYQFSVCCRYRLEFLHENTVTGHREFMQCS